MFKYIILAAFFASSLSCDYNGEFKTATCYSVTDVAQRGTPEWGTLKIKNERNTLEIVRDNTFSKSPNIHVLTFQKSIKGISENSLSGLKKLQKLELFDNDVSTIPGNLLRNLPVERVYFINSGIKILGSELFTQATNVKAIYIRKNAIKNIPRNVFSDSNIEELYLEHNRIETIEDGAFTNMDSLTRLSLAGNKLKDFKLLNLFGTNSFELDRLWLSKNQLKKVSKYMFSDFTKMKYLFLEMNQIEIIEDGAFKNLKNLIGLDLSNNNIWDMSPNIFPPVSDIEVFLIHNNRMTFVKDEVFDMMPKLKFLSIYGNPLQCPCYQHLRAYLGDRNVTRVCEDNNKEGRPKCIIGKTGTDNTKCSYLVEQNKYLYEDYRIAMTDYAPWEKKCHFAEGYDGLKWQTLPKD